MSLKALHPLPTQFGNWQSELAQSFTSSQGLFEAELITAEELEQVDGIDSRFRIRVSRYYASLMDHSPEGRKHCPIRKQALPFLDEIMEPGLPKWAQDWSLQAFGRPQPWDPDPIGDLEHLATPRLTHRYSNRAILHLSSLCAVYCRFCFRKSHLNDSERTLYDGSLEPALDYLRKHPEISELILTGGDPLSLPDPWLGRFLEKLHPVSSIRHLRIHSRMAVTLPSRLTPGLAKLFSSQPFMVSLVSHFNHPRELTSFALSQLDQMRKHGIALYNQSVLLRGVNDSEDTLCELFQGLYDHGINPFYLHHPDWTPGTFHFRVPIERGRELTRKLAGRLSGPALPHYVLDIPGGAGKVSLMDESLVRKIQNLEEIKPSASQKSKISGALYQVHPPNTRHRTDSTSTQKPKLYADFWFNFSSYATPQ